MLLVSRQILKLVVSYLGSLYELKATAAVGVSPEDDPDVWQLLYIGEFYPIDVTNIAGTCDEPETGTVEYNADLCISINTGVSPDKVEQFVASGNFLNWVMASKFDVQKDILTGGKYDEITER